MRDLKEFESKIEIKFDNKNLLKNVFIHRKTFSVSFGSKIQFKNGTENIFR